LYQTVEGLRGLGHEIHLFCADFAVEPPSGVIKHRVPIVPLGRTLRLWSFAWFASRAVAEVACDVVVSFGRLARQDVLRSGGGTHRGFLNRLGQQGGLCRRLWQSVSLYHRSVLALERRQYDRKGSRKIIAVSEEVKRDIIANYPVPADRIVVLYNGVDLARFHPDRRREFRRQIRERWKVPLDASLVLFVGSGFRRKGLDHLIPVWKSPKLEEVFLMVVGDDSRLGRYQAWANHIAPGRILFTGRQEDIENYYAAADVVALPALQEAFGNVVMEGLASGLPVLVSRFVGAAEIIHGPLSAGIIGETNNEAELEHGLLLLLAKAKDPTCVHQARSLSEKYSWQGHFKKLESILREVYRESMRAVT
jgi:UDP-glucose:(heptosyl)LPS alpha-1,3-glucosyltransferase